MPYARDEAGNVWETDAAGNAIRLAQPVQQPQAMTIGAPNPVRQQQAATSLAGDQLTNQGRAVENRVAQATAGANISKAQADAEKAAADAARSRAEAAAADQKNVEWAATHNPDGSLKATSPRAQSPERLAQIKTLLGTVARLRNLAQETAAVGGSSEYLRRVPFLNQNRRNVEGALQQVEGDLIQQQLAVLSAANGGNGVASLANSEGEARRMAASVANLDPNQSLNEFLNGLDKAESFYLRQAAPGGQVTQEVLNQYLPEESRRYAAQRLGVAAGNDGNQGGGPQQLTSQGQFVSDPGLAGANATVRQMIEAGSQPAQIRAYLDSIRPGYGSQVNGIEEAVADWRQNPGNRRQVNIDLEKVWQPASGISQTLGDIGMSPLGSALIGAGDVASFGLLDNLTGNPEQTRAVMTGLQEINPNAYLAGQVAGGVGTGLGLESLVGRAGVGAARSALTADALMGTAYGAGSADDPGQSRIANALLGAGAGVAGNVIGTRAANALGGALTGVRDASRQALNQAGVRMTPGQAAGGWVGRMEDRLAGFPIVGDAINARRSEGVQDFNRAAFDQALAPINANTNGVIGAQGIDLARQARSDAYDNALNGVYVQADAPFVSDIQSVIGQGQRLPATMADNAAYTLNRMGESFDQNGGITGVDYQQMLRGLRRDASAMENLPYGYDFGQVTRGAEGALEGMVGRQSPETVTALQAANEANRNVETLRAAVNSARNGARSRQVDVFMPSQLSDAAAASARKYGNSAGTTNQPFFDLTRAGQEVLPSQVPDSGTAGRLVLPLAAGALAGGGSYAAQGEDASAASTLGTGAVAAALLAAPYSQGARSAIQRALLAERPQAAQRAGEYILSNAELARLLAAPSAVVYAGE